MMQGAYMPRASQTRPPAFEDDFEVTFSPDCFDVGLNEAGNGAYSRLFLIYMVLTSKTKNLPILLDLNWS